jgi:hypothetical protein
LVRGELPEDQLEIVGQTFSVNDLIFFVAPYVRKDVASRINVKGGEREGQASGSATIGGV